MKKLSSALVRGAALGICYLVIKEAVAKGETATASQSDEEEIARNLTIIEARLGSFMMSNLVRGLAREATTDPAGLISSLRYSIKLGN